MKKLNLNYSTLAAIPFVGKIWRGSEHSKPKQVVECDIHNYTFTNVEALKEEFKDKVMVFHEYKKQRGEDSVFYANDYFKSLKTNNGNLNG